MPHTFRRTLLRSLVLTMLALGASGAAWAHAALTKSVPGNREVLTQSPTRLHLQFNEKVEARFSTVSLEDAKGNKARLGTPVASPDNAYALDVDVTGPLVEGRHTVKYRVLSQDGHVIERSFSFTLKSAPASPAAP